MSSSSEESDGAFNVEPSVDEVMFDQMLPSTHEYLHVDLEDHNRMEELPNGFIIYHLPIINQANETVIYPGNELPMIDYNRRHRISISEFHARNTVPEPLRGPPQVSQSSNMRDLSTETAVYNGPVQSPPPHQMVATPEVMVATPEQLSHRDENMQVADVDLPSEPDAPMPSSLASELSTDTDTDNSQQPTIADRLNRGIETYEIQLDYNLDADDEDDVEWNVDDDDGGDDFIEHHSHTNMLYMPPPPPTRGEQRSSSSTVRSDDHEMYESFANDHGVLMPPDQRNHFMHRGGVHSAEEGGSDSEEDPVGDTSFAPHYYAGGDYRRGVGAGGEDDEVFDDLFEHYEGMRHDGKLSDNGKPIKMPMIFGMLNDIQQIGNINKWPEYKMYGTLCSIQGWNATENERFQSIGVQKFRIMSFYINAFGVVLASVRMCVDESPRNYMSNTYNDQRFLKKSLFSPYSGIAPWVEKQYNMKFIIREVQMEIVLRWSMKLANDVRFTQPPDLFSYWLSSNVLFTCRMKQIALSLPSSLHRFKYLLDVIKKMNKITCKSCGGQQHTVADITKDAVTINGVTGPMGRYVNPAGQVHDTLTLSVANHVRAVTRPVKNDTWFPGYEWAIAECTFCGSHMGWKFTAILPQLRPAYFWGLICKNIDYLHNNDTHILYDNL